MNAEAIAARMIPGDSGETCTFVSDEFRLARAAVHHVFETNASVKFALTDSVLTELERDKLHASKLQELLDEATVTVTRLNVSSPGTIALSGEDLNLPTLGVADDIDCPVVSVDRADEGAAIAGAYEQLIAAGEPVTTSFAETGWTALLAAMADTFDEGYRERFVTAVEEAIESLSDTRPALLELLCLVAADRERTQNEVCQFAERHGIVSRGTVTNAIADLEDAGLVEREPVPVDRRGRPPKRLFLTDTSSEPADYVHYTL